MQYIIGKILISVGFLYKNNCQFIRKTSEQKYREEEKIVLPFPSNKEVKLHVQVIDYSHERDST